MDLPVNHFRRRLHSGEAQVGLWLDLAGPYRAELAANTGFDWLLLSGEHAPNDLHSLFGQLQALAPYPGQPVTHPVQDDTVLIKQLPGIDVQTLLASMVDSATQAGDLMHAMRYPSAGICRVGSVLVRASRWNSVAEYLDHTDEQMCLLVQAENLEGLANLDAVAAIEGVDGVFIGPADLSVTMGRRGNPSRPEMQAAIEDAIRRIRAAGKAAGIPSVGEALTRHYLELGCAFIMMGMDTSLLMYSLRELAGRFKDNAPMPSASFSTYG